MQVRANTSPGCQIFPVASQPGLGLLLTSSPRYLQRRRIPALLSRATFRHLQPP